MFREWELARYDIDRVVCEKHGLGIFPDSYVVEFEEVEFPLSPSEERAWLDWKLDKGIMTKKELLLYFNPDMNEDELQAKLQEVSEEKRIEREETAPPRPTFGGLRNLGTTR